MIKKIRKNKEAKKLPKNNKLLNIFLIIVL
jgi:hypothetical protein